MSISTPVFPALANQSKGNAVYMMSFERQTWIHCPSLPTTTGPTQIKKKVRSGRGNPYNANPHEAAEAAERLAPLASLGLELRYAEVADLYLTPKASRSTVLSTQKSPSPAL